MAQKNTRSQAQKAASGQKKNTASGKSATNKRNSAQSAKQAEPKTQIPVRLITSVVSLVVFIVLLIALLEPEGPWNNLVRSFVMGMVGQTSFYVAIPALLYLFVIQAFSGKRPVRLRSFCLIAFVLLCGCISQLHLDTSELPGGFSVLVALYNGGLTGQTAGLLCGGIAIVLHMIFETTLSYIILTVAALLTLLASCQITIPSIIRAVQNRPRADWENDEPELEEPATVVVNHLANKRIEYVENKRRQQAERAQIDIPVDDEPAAPIAAPKRKLSRKATEFMSQVDADVATPVAAAQEGFDADADVDLIMPTPTTAPAAKTPERPANTINIDPVPDHMLPFEKEDTPVEDAPAPMPEPVAAPKQEKVTAKDAQESAAQVAAEIAQAEAEEKPEYCLPLTLFLSVLGPSADMLLPFPPFFLPFPP